VVDEGDERVAVGDFDDGFAEGGEVAEKEVGRVVGLGSSERMGGSLEGGFDFGDFDFAEGGGGDEDEEGAEAEPGGVFVEGESGAGEFEGSLLMEGLEAGGDFLRRGADLASDPIGGFVLAGVEDRLAVLDEGIEEGEHWAGGIELKNERCCDDGIRGILI